MKYLIVVLMLVLMAVAIRVFADTRILFSSNWDGDRYSLFVMNPDGTDPVNLYEELDVRADLVWSPDGTKILFASERPGDQRFVNDGGVLDVVRGPAEIFVMNSNGANRVNLTNDEGWDKHPRWSPDAMEIVFESDRNGDWEIFVMNADGSNLSNLGSGNKPKWSPDGTKIGFDRARDNTWQFDAFIMNADGSGRVKLADLPGSSTGFLSWSPVRTKVAFLGLADHDFLRSIYVVNADGSNLTNLTDGFTDSTHASWSPDETKIAFQSDIGEVLDMDVFVVNVDGTHPVNLSNHRGWDAGPWWSPDGSQILFNTVRDGNFEIYSMNVDGSNPLDLTNHPADDNSGTWLDTSPTLVSPEDKLIMTWGR